MRLHVSVLFIHWSWPTSWCFTQKKIKLQIWFVSLYIFCHLWLYVVTLSFFVFVGIIICIFWYAIIYYNHSCLPNNHFVKLFSNHYYFDFVIDRTQPGVRCPPFLEETIKTTAGITVDLNDTVTTGAIFYPNQFITLNPSTLDGPRQVNATLQDKWGTTDTCTFLIYTKGKDFAKYC